MNTQTRYTLIERASVQVQVRKSRFLALAQSIGSGEDAMAFLTAHVYSDATHHCWAYRVGEIYRFDDDGEPGGTAGRPILQAIDSQQCDRVVVLVARWFGGIKLGTGGLARAYGATAAQCLRLAHKAVLVDAVDLHCTCPFADMARVRARLHSFGARIVQEHFDTQGVVWHLELPRAQANEFLAVFLQLTRGQGRAQIQGARDAAPSPCALLGKEGEFHDK